VAEALETHQRVAEAGRHLAASAGLLVAILAVISAIVAIMTANAANTMILSQGKAADTWNAYETNTLKSELNLNDSEILRLLATGASRQQALALAQHFESKAAKLYGPRQATLLPKARALERTRDTNEIKYHTFEFAESSLQLGVVLASVAVVTDLILFLWAAGMLGSIGIVLAILGVLAVHTPL
jgi:hypothetical protein